MQSPTPSRLSVAGHLDSDEKRENDFDRTTLLLSFTDFSRSLMVSAQGEMFVQAYLLETVMSAIDKGSWVSRLGCAWV
jgi:hypothetical protein